MIGERGGACQTLAEAQDLLEENKPHWSAMIRATIQSALVETGSFHSDDLVALQIPEAHKACVGAQVMAVIKKGYMAETGIRRATSDPAGHSRKSAVYRITELGCQKLQPEPRAGVSDSHPSVADSISEPPGPVPLFELETAIPGHTDPDQRRAA